MKNTITCALAALMLAFAAGASAQIPWVYEFPSADPAFTQYAAPQSVIKIRLTVKKEITRSGPYARYAQRMLGVTAPLADRDAYTIAGATVTCENPTGGKAVTVPRYNTQMPAERSSAVSLTRSDTAFVKVTPDRSQLAGKSQEEMARDAANAIFKLRKQRLDMISGEMGENVFGAGMHNALFEINRLENEYLALFLGKQTVETTVREYSLIPSRDKLNYVVARFSASAGLLPDTDLSGEPVMLALKPESTLTAPPATKGTKSKSGEAVAYRLAEQVQCRVMTGAAELTRNILPLYQFGITVEAAK